jgi:DNA (cytosine-5)-methyltransferase 1
MLRTLGDLGYSIEWTVANSADYGFPQRRIRVFIVAVRLDSIRDPEESFELAHSQGLFAYALGSVPKGEIHSFDLPENVEELSRNFNLESGRSPFLKAGIYRQGTVKTWDFIAPAQSFSSLGDVLLDEDQVPKEFFIEEERVQEWEYLKGAKSIPRTSKAGHTYSYSEGKMAFPDSLDKPSRTILTGEGGKSPSRFKHVVNQSGRFRRLTPLELERLSGFPDDWTRFDSSGAEISSAKRGFFVGNALVVGLVERIGRELNRRFG